jgi:hypothetical protein
MTKQTLAANLIKTAEDCLTEFFSKRGFPPDKNIRAQAAKEEKILKTRQMTN